MVNFIPATVNGITHNTVLDEFQVKKVLEKYNPDAYRFTDYIFGSDDRITIPIGDISLINNDVYGNNADYRKVFSFLNDKTYEIVDYAKGLCRKWGDKNNIKIGKVLERNKADPEVVAAFTNGPSRQAARKRAENLCITISRNPFDVASMSTNRGWTSCMNLNGGFHKKKVLMDVKHGTHIAYLHDKNDVDILKPMARVLLKAHRKKYTRINGFKKVLVPEPRQYGMGVENFVSTVTEWCNNNFSPEEDVIYSKSGQLYDDGSGADYIRFSENSRYLTSENRQDRLLIAYKGTDAHRIKLAGDSSTYVVQTALNHLTDKKNMVFFFDKDSDGSLFSYVVRHLDIKNPKHRDYIMKTDLKNQSGYSLRSLLNNILRDPKISLLFEEKIFNEVSPDELLYAISQNITSKEDPVMNKLFERFKNEYAIHELFAVKSAYFDALSPENKEIVLNKINDNLYSTSGSQLYVSYLLMFSSDMNGIKGFKPDDIPDVKDKDPVAIKEIKKITKCRLSKENFVHSLEKPIMDRIGDFYGIDYIENTIVNQLYTEMFSIIEKAVHNKSWPERNMNRTVVDTMRSYF